jgi:hypothetical protein
MIFGRRGFAGDGFKVKLVVTKAPAGQKNQYRVYDLRLVSFCLSFHDVYF